MTAATLPTRADEATAFARIVDELTRRGLFAGGLSLVTLSGLVACGGQGPSGTPSSAPATRTVDSVKGMITVPADPQRIVSINQADTTVLFDLGLTPVGIFDYGVDYTPPRYRDRYNAAPKIGKTGIEVEKVAALRPDLILGFDIEFNTKVYDQLSALAPTVIVPAGAWQRSAQAIAEAVNRSNAYDGLKRKYQQRCAQLRTDYADVLGSTRWDILQGGFDNGACWVFGPQAAIIQVLTDAGVRLAATSTAATGPTGTVYKALSYEKLGQLADADVIAYWSGYGATKPVNNGPQLFSQPLWKTLPAVRGGRLVPIADVPLSGYGDALAALDEFEAGLKKVKEAS